MAESEGWVRDELAHLQLGDARLNKRLEQLVVALAAKPDATGGFGGLLMVAVEWASSEKWNRSLELFARYVMPHFRGHTADLKREWKRTQDARKAGVIPVVLGRDLKDEFPAGGDRTNLDMHTNV